jgi:hypothetical protein
VGLGWWQENRWARCQLGGDGEVPLASHMRLNQVRPGGQTRHLRFQTRTAELGPAGWSPGRREVGAGRDW